MLRSMNSAITGLRMHQMYMDVIGNNIANVNTTAFKSGRVTFQNLLSQTIRSSVAPTETRGGINNVQVGMGSTVAGVEMTWTQGGLNATNKVTDLAITGEGFFVVTDGFQNFYTRDGAFDLDENGVLISPNSGLKVAGWIADNGVINTNRPPEPGITIPLGQAVAAKKSSEVQLNGNLNGAPTHILKTGIAEQGTETGTGQQAAIAFKITQGDTLTFTYDGVTYTTPVADNLGPPATPPTNGGLPERALGAQMGSGANAGATVGTVAADIETAMYAALRAADPVKFPALAAGQRSPIKVGVVDDGGLTGGEAFFTFTSDKSMAFGNAPSTNIDLGNVMRNRVSEGLEILNSTIQVYDSLGNTHDVTIRFEKVSQIEDPSNPAAAVMTPVQNTWRWSATGGKVDINGADVTGKPLGGGWGYIKFDPSGRFQAVETRALVTPIPAAPAAQTSIAQTSKAVVRFDWDNGSQNDQDVTLDFSKITELQDGNTVAEAKNDGFATGTLLSFVIGQDGTVKGQYSNGKDLDLAQISMATFANAGGLTTIGSNLFVESPNSGGAMIGEARTGSRGSINAGQLEMSNVDLAEQFTNMIRAQRGFQANSRIITTSDEMLQDLVNLKR